MSAQSETDQSKFAKICINVDLANSGHLLANPRCIGPKTFYALL